ncbi:MAG: hypothetical protein L6R38_008597 [Xanthoria sp. 2 TBL-2021]|nr:MAG: hypothetical protein L6R38_008597 [Xanthoria sp. 2 TBL-2021]
MPTNKRQTNTCSPGYSFYTCATTGFKGCCSADACAMIDGCPLDQRDPDDLASMAQEDAANAARRTSQDSSSTAADTSTYSLRVHTPPRTLASTSTPTVQSSSASQASPTTSGTPTGSSSSATAAAETAAPGGGTSSSNSTSKTPIIIGMVVGVVVAAIAVWLIWFGARRRRKRIRDEATKPEREHWLQGQPSPGSDQGLGIYSERYYSAASVPSKQDGSVPSSQSSPNSGGLFPSPGVPSELSAEPSPKPELSPNPETLEINKARDQSGLSSEGTPTTDSHPSPRHPAGATEMRSNLEVSDEDDKRRGSHVMSWMSYSNGAAGPGGGAG